jgi:acyl carrier protein
MEEKRQDTFSKLTKIIQGFIDVGIISKPKEALTPKTRLCEDLGMDSLDRCQLSYELKSKFGISITDQEMGFVSLGECVKYIDKYKR